MKIHVERLIIKNRAPFDYLDLSFDENGIAVLTAVNGSGKTTILSYIVDAWHEMARPHFSNEFAGKETSFYRVSSNIYSIDNSNPSLVYIRFRAHNEIFDYIDARGELTQEKYDEIVKLENKILFENFQQGLKEENYTKTTSANFDKKKAFEIFTNNVITYFPAYRYEQPGYLNNPYKIRINFKKEMSYSGYLNNPIEVVAGLPQLANWIMDVVLDMDLYKQTQNINGQIIDFTPERNVLWSSLNLIISQTLISKKHKGKLRFGIGRRNSGGTRISIMCDKVINGNNVSEQIYPSIFNLSSGESAMLCLFGEILRQADNNINNIPLNTITGIVLIDEVDKHLHIKLQKEVLPQLFNLFPNVQFILSSHSPFLNMGLAEKAKERTRIIDLDNMGVSTDPTTNELYVEVYNMMISENDRFKETYFELKQAIDSSTKPLIVTEGKTDVLHIKKAKEVLNIEDCDVDFYEIVGDWGDSKLKLLLEQLSKVKQNRKIIGIFDRDVESIVKDIEKNNQPYKDYYNNVYAFCIPTPPNRVNYTNISIEFYYTDNEIKKEKDGRCLYFDNEVDYLYNKSTNLPEYKKLDNPRIGKEQSKKILDEQKMCDVTNWIHSKANFAALVETNEEFTQGFDFSKFNAIFDKIKQIIVL